MMHAFEKAREKKWRKVVRDNLDNCFTNGYFDKGEELHGATPEEIALDMMDKASDCQNAKPEELTPHIAEWLKETRI